MQQLTATDHAELDAFWARPARPLTPIAPEQQFGAVTITVTCRVCGARASQAISSEGLLCGACRADLDAATAAVGERLDALREEEAMVMETWVDAQAGLDDTTAARWVTLCADRDRVIAQLERAKRGPYYNWTNEQIAANIAAKQAVHDEVMGRIARTAQKPGPLAQLLKGYDLWRAALASIADRRGRCEQGLAEIDAARTGAAPF
jgi:hypothetical protein